MIRDGNRVWVQVEQPVVLDVLLEGDGSEGVIGDQEAAADGLSARSLRKYHTMLHSIFKRAVRDQLIVTNPV